MPTEVQKARSLGTLARAPTSSLDQLHFILLQGQCRPQAPFGAGTKQKGLLRANGVFCPSLYAVLSSLIINLIICHPSLRCKAHVHSHNRKDQEHGSTLSNKGSELSYLFYNIIPSLYIT